MLKLETLKDDAFASGVLGKGVGIWPEEGNVYALSLIHILFHIREIIRLCRLWLHAAVLLLIMYIQKRLRS